MNENSVQWIIGIDGGGTKCKASLYNLAGNKMGESIAGPANVFADFEQAIESIVMSSKDVLEAYNVSHQQKIMLNDCILSAGCAGAGIEAAYKRFMSWEHPFKNIHLSTDIHFSCIAANLNQACALIVVGTGSCIAFYDKQQTNKSVINSDNTAPLEVKQIGGHGFLLGDNASGAWLGKKALAWFLQAIEGKVNDSALFEALQAKLGSDVSALIEQYGRANGSAFGQLVPVLVMVKEESDNVQAWVQEGADYLAGVIEEHINEDQPIFIDGGMASLYQPILSELLASEIFAPKQEPTHGAYLYAIAQLQNVN